MQYQKKYGSLMVSIQGTLSVIGTSDVAQGRWHTLILTDSTDSDDTKRHIVNNICIEHLTLNNLLTLQASIADSLSGILERIADTLNNGNFVTVRIIELREMVKSIPSGSDFAARLSMGLDQLIEKYGDV